MRNTFPIATRFAGSDRGRQKVPRAGVLIINADDWGRDRLTTQRTLECLLAGAISSLSAMVFMEDSERSAGIAQERQVDVGLHLNLTTAFSARHCPSRLSDLQRQVAGCLMRHRFAQAVFHPTLMRAFEYVVSAQIEEFSRIYGAAPMRIDGHHHMHLCANVLFGGLLPSGTIARRNFSFQPGEKSPGNRLYRRLTDCILARNHRLTDYFFSLPPLEPTRLERIFSLARDYVVEVETHPANTEEHAFLARGAILRWSQDSAIATKFVPQTVG